MGELNLLDLRKKMNVYVSSAALDKRVLEAILLDGKVVPKECELWDYKVECGRDGVSLAETVVQIVSFYNTYGGYLIYGISETNANREYVPVGIIPNILNVQQIKQLLVNYTGTEKIDVSYVEISHAIEGKDMFFGLLHVPRRLVSIAPAFFGKDGPEKKKGQLVFHKDSAYLRSQDSCIPAKTKEDYQLLFGDRDNPFIWDTDTWRHQNEGSKIIVEHNLPDRNFICAKFIGRDLIIEDLWKWLADELSHVKVLAGDGGKGKTSIAYEFAEEICKTKPYNVDKLIWLTAKRRQFIGELNQFINVPYTNYFDLESLLKAICQELAIKGEELEGASVLMLKRFIKEALEKFVCIVVIDDLDSTEIDQQKTILETAMQFPGSGTRFLITTRMNLTSSSSVCIQVPGLHGKEYIRYVNELTKRFKYRSLSDQEIERIALVTEGSPLFTESLLRFCKLGTPIDRAMAQWKGKMGQEVREAALKREIERLTVDSRRILLACSYMGEASVTELKQATGYSDDKMQSCINELQSLSLIATRPIIEKEARFTVPNNTVNLIQQDRSILVPDSNALENIVKKLRKNSFRTENRYFTHTIRSAITQAGAFLREKNPDDALATLKEAFTENKNDPDLLSARGRCYEVKYELENDTKYLNEARKTFIKAYDLGQRKEPIYTLWFKCEMMADNPNGAVDVAKLALENINLSKTDWLERRATAHIELSRSMSRNLNYGSALDEMKKAAADTSDMGKAYGNFQKSAILERLYQLNDEIWALSLRQLEDIWIKPQDSYEVQRLNNLRGLRNTAETCIKLGDYRRINFDHQFYTIEESLKILGNLDRGALKLTHFPRQMLRKSQSLIEITKRELPEEEVKYIKQRQREIEQTLSSLEGDLSTRSH